MLGLFKKKKVKFEGRGGLTFKYEGEDYLIGSEMSLAKDIDIVIYEDLIKNKDGTAVTDEPTQKKILASLLHCLEKEEKLKVVLFKSPTSPPDAGK